MPTYSISKDFEFSAAHVLSGLPDDHPCSRMHGHNYIVRVSLSAPLNPVGFVRDYRELGQFRKYLTELCDHRVLNDRMPDGVNPTAENLAYLFLSYLRDYFPEVVAVGVSETPKTWAWCYYE